MKGPAFTLQSGFSLLEVMVSGAILSSGLAGLAALLLASVSGTAQSGYRTTASLLADSMAAQIEITPASGEIFLLEPPSITLNCQADSGCTSAQFAASGLRAWLIEIPLRLPGGEGIICRDSTPFDGRRGAPGCDGAGQVTIKVFWQPGARLGSSPARVARVVG